MTLEASSCRTHLAICPVQTTNLLSPSKLGSRPDNVGEFKDNRMEYYLGSSPSEPDNLGPKTGPLCPIPCTRL